jgi:hypothetical protein
LAHDAVHRVRAAMRKVNAKVASQDA